MRGTRIERPPLNGSKCNYQTFRERYTSGETARVVRSSTVCSSCNKAYASGRATVYSGQGVFAYSLPSRNGRSFKLSLSLSLSRSVSLSLVLALRRETRKHASPATEMKVQTERKERRRCWNVGREKERPVRTYVRTYVRSGV